MGESAQVWRHANAVHVHFEMVLFWPLVGRPPHDSTTNHASKLFTDSIQWEESSEKSHSTCLIEVELEIELIK